METNQSNTLPRERDHIDRTYHHGSLNQFNIYGQEYHLGAHAQRRNLYPQNSGYLSAPGLTTPFFDYNNGISPQFNALEQGPHSAPPFSTIDRSTMFNMPTQGLNTDVHSQNQISPDQFDATIGEPLTFFHGPGAGANRPFQNFYPDHLAPSDMFHTASENHSDFQAEQNFQASSFSQDGATHLNVSSPDQRIQFQEQARGIGVQNHLAPQPSSRTPDHQVQSAVTRHIPGPYSPGAPSPPSAIDTHSTHRGRAHHILNGLQTPILARPRTRNNFQHSPPRRAFHSPITPETTIDFPTTPADIPPISLALALSPAAAPHSITTTTTTTTSSPGHIIAAAIHHDVVRQRLETAEQTKKMTLQNLTEKHNELRALERDIVTGWAQPNANDNLHVLYKGEESLIELRKEWERYAQDFRRWEGEIEDLWADLTVLGDDVV